MRRSIFAKDLEDQARGLIGWSVGVALTVLIVAAFWPWMGGMADLARMLESFPEQMRRLFQVEAMTSGSGFLNVELFSIMLPIIFLVFGIARGARLVAGEEEAGTLEVLASLSVPRLRILIEKGAVLVVSLSALGAVTFLSTWAATALFDMGVPVGEALAASVAMVLLGVEFGLVALAVGAVTGNRGMALGAAAVLAAGSYLLFVAGALVEAVEPWRIVSPFQQALEGGPLGGGWRIAYVWMPAVGVAGLLAAMRAFDRRDLGA
jgi:ABC-2 type transport system permease protein